MTEFAGTHYATDALAALAFAATVLPDPSEVREHEDPIAVARNLEAYCYREADQSGTLDLGLIIDRETTKLPTTIKVLA
jgi:hypothetical protein